MSERIPLRKLRESGFCLPVGYDDALKCYSMLCESCAMACGAKEGDVGRGENVY
jgi:hypothetical protein